MLYVTNFRDKLPDDVIVINTTSRSNNWTKGFSPFVLKPYCVPNCYNIENLWQFSKVYKDYIGEDGNPTKEWFKWRDKGFSTRRGIRYPMGKGVEPEYSYWFGKKFDYIEARKNIYFPVYSQSVVLSKAYSTLYDLYKKDETDIYLFLYTKK